MPNIGKVLKDEISRIARRESKAAVTPVRKPVYDLRLGVADLKRRLAVLEKANRDLQSRLATIEAAQPAAPEPEPDGRAWISGQGIKSLRKRLGVSQADLATLVGVSEQAVYMWEQKSGMLNLRKETKPAVMAVRKIGATEAKKRLAELKAKTKKGKGKKA
jgi:DNA-binding transcriptional regulator YiaG